jgi:hypothetical protein
LNRRDAKAAVSGEAVGQHAPIPRLEDVQRERIARKKHDRKWKEWQPERHAGR